MQTHSLCMSGATLASLLKGERVTHNLRGALLEVTLCKDVLAIDVIAAVEAAGDYLLEPRAAPPESVIPGQVRVLPASTAQRQVEDTVRQLERDTGWQHVRWMDESGCHVVAPAIPPKRVRAGK